MRFIAYVCKTKMKRKFTMRNKIIMMVVLAFISIINVSAQVFDPVKWSYSSVKINDNEAELTFIAKIDEGWSMYSQHIPQDNPNGAPVPTSFKFVKSSDYSLMGSVSESKTIKKLDMNFDMTVKLFKKQAVFKQKVNINNNQPVTIKGSVEYMTCDDSKCLPPTEQDFSFTIEGAKNAVAVTSSTTANVASEPVSTTSADTLGSSDKTASATSVKPADAIDTSDDSSSYSLLGFFLIAFLAGLAAILMPCIFPMIPMTVSFFMRPGISKAKSRAQALVYSLSIIGIYSFIGVFISATLGPDFVNWLSTHWAPNLFFFVIFIIFAASFFGLFELTLPNWLINKSDKQADKGGWLGSFFMALTLVLISFSCTVPIVGMILVEASRGEILKPIIGMLGFSLAFALPFGFFAFFPSKLSALPKSGGWLNSVKIVFGFLELALSLKFLMVVDQVYQWNLLSRDLYIAIWIVLFTLMGLYLLGKIRFDHDTDVKHISIPRLILVIITFSFVVYLIPGMFGAPLRAFSGYLPPQESHSFDLNAIIRENAESVMKKQTASSLCEEPKHKDLFKLPHGLDGYFDYKQAMACAKAQNKPIFVDFTGKACVNCWEMEQNVLSDPRIKQRLRDNYIVVALYVDSKQELPESDWVKSKADGKMKTTIGKVNSDIQISLFGSNAQPYYVLLDANGNKLVKPMGHNLDIDNFIKFLDKGVEEFKKK